MTHSPGQRVCRSHIHAALMLLAGACNLEGSAPNDRSATVAIFYDGPREAQAKSYLHSLPAQVEVRLSDRRSFVDGLHYMIARGGAPVLHKLQPGLAECFADAIFPVAFETPHYAASETDYRAMQRVFQVFNERTMSARRQVSPARLSGRASAPGTGFVANKKAWILWLDRAAIADTNNQQSYRAVLETFGYQIRVVKLADFKRVPAAPETVLVVPRGAGARLSETQQQEILRYLAAGGALVVDGKQEWLSKLGLRWMGRSVSVSTVADLLFPEMPLRWQGQDPVERFTPPEGIRELMVDKESSQVLAFMGQHGSGRYIYLAAPLDPHTAEAISHYPYFPKYLSEAFGTSSSLRSPHLEAYFDPSFRAGADLNKLAAAWPKSGIRIIYVAAWLFSREYSFNYAEFIETCHRNGLSVYAWFVFPAVTQKMWDEHPEWRERTATGADGRVGWRYSMNFQNPACFRAAMDWMSGLLRAHPWDGVNLTELNYDADFENYLRADRFVPMNQEVQREFERRAGFDPALLFKEDSPYYHKRNAGALHKFLRYREEIVLDWHRRVLRELEPLRRARNWEVIVTMLDGLHSDYVRAALGVDSRRIVGLMKRFGFTLQVEDPAHYWTQPPDRYRRFAKAYLKLVPEARRLMFDVNVMPDRDVTHTTLPSATATGTELARTVAAAASASGRVAIYSEHTVAVQDWVFLKTALTRPASLKAGNRKW